MTRCEVLGRCYKLMDVSRSLNKPARVPEVVLDALFRFAGESPGLQLKPRPDQFTEVWAETLSVFVQRVESLSSERQLELPGIH